MTMSLILFLNISVSYVILIYSFLPETFSPNSSFLMSLNDIFKQFKKVSLANELS